MNIKHFLDKHIHKKRGKFVIEMSVLLDRWAIDKYTIIIHL